MRPDQLNEQNYWAPLRALAASAGCTLEEKGAAAIFRLDGKIIATVGPQTQYGYTSTNVSGYIAHGNYLPQREQRRGYGDNGYRWVQRKTLVALIEALRPALRTDTPEETFHKDFFAKRDSMLVDVRRSYASEYSKDAAAKVLLAMFREGLITDPRALCAKVGSVYMGIDKPAIPVTLEEALTEESKRIDDEIGNEIVMELFRAAYPVCRMNAGLPEERE